jgi:hypothetical protein
MLKVALQLGENIITVYCHFSKKKMVSTNVVCVHIWGPTTIKDVNKKQIFYTKFEIGNYAFYVHLDFGVVLLILGYLS